LLHRAADYAQIALPSWMPALLGADEKLRGALVQTLRAYAQANMSVSATARALNVHPNTLYARFERIRSLTGVNAQSYHDLEDILLALDCQAS
jgi:sugar diacid utilization regulator